MPPLEKGAVVVRAHKAACSEWAHIWGQVRCMHSVGADKGHAVCVRPGVSTTHVQVPAGNLFSPDSTVCCVCLLGAQANRSLSNK